ncbi:MAG: sodium:calcium antiporter [candidate division WOR-3 bacterium]
MVLLLIGFFLCTGIIFFAGTRLSYYSDVIAEKSGLGRTLIGLILVASITSLPEMVNSISAVTYAQVPDIAAGDLIGSCVFNLLIIAFLDLFYRKIPISSVAQTGHIISGSFGILQLSIVIVSLFLKENMPAFGWIGLNSVIFIIIYFLAMRLTFQYERKLIENVNNQNLETYPGITLNKAITLFIINAFFVIIAAIFLPKIGEGIAEITGLGQTFVGNILIAWSTSLPETVVCFSALRCKAVDLALGNLMGSTIFNIAILGIVDLIYTKGSILTLVNQNHIISALSGIIITAVVIISLTYRAEKKYLPLSFDAIFIVIIYILNLVLLYLLR